jgi:hypothetical protein
MRKWLASLAFLIGGQAAVAQTVRGTVTADERPVTGIVVILVDAGAKEVARALTNARGEYGIVAPRPGSYRLRTMRIGFQSVFTEPFALVTGDNLTKPLTVSMVAFTLDTVRAVGRNQCRVVAADSTSVVAAIWDQVRSALLATQLTLSNRTIQSTSITYERMLDLRSQRIGSQVVDLRVDYARHPWRSLTAARLREGGYVYTLEDSSRVYNAPDLAVLLSDEFIEDHCFRISVESNAQRLGIEFQPTAARRRTPEIRGTIWLDRGTNELVEMEHGYVNRVDAEEEKIAGGTMGFTRLRDGMWAISRWSIRMPVFALTPVLSPTFAVVGHKRQLDSIKVAGGELVMATTTGSRRDTLWVRPPIALRGTVVDSLSGAPVRNAIVSLVGTVQLDTTDAAGRFSIGGVLPGRYAITTTTPSLDSLNTVDQRSILFVDSSMTLTLRVPNASMIAGTICGRNNTASGLGSGIALGSVTRAADSAGVANAAVSAQWTEIVLGGSQGSSTRIREVETRTDARGVFRICGLPTATVITIHAKAESAEANPLRIEISTSQPFARADLVIPKP